MRLRASFTMENSVIIPLFTIFIVMLVLTGLNLHDSVIFKSACFQAAMKLEWDGNDAASQNSYLSEVASYAQSKSMRTSYSVSDVTEGVNKAGVADNNPRDFIRKRCALDALRTGEQ